MAGWINDYKMDYSPVVNALRAKYDDRADRRAFLSTLLNTLGSTAGNLVDVHQRAKAMDALQRNAMFNTLIKNGYTQDEANNIVLDKFGE